jgi:hypothetical protein
MTIYKNIQFKIQKRVGYSMVISLIIICIANFFIHIFYNKKNILGAIISPEFIFIALFIFPIYLTTRKDNIIFRGSQVLIFIVLCFYSIIGNPIDSLIDVYFLICAIILGIQYNFLKSILVKVIIIFFFLFSITKLLAGYLNDPNTYLRGLPSIFAGLVFIYYLGVFCRRN